MVSVNVQIYKINICLKKNIDFDRFYILDFTNRLTQVYIILQINVQFAYL
jgi:hypothetical protein